MIRKIRKDMIFFIISISCLIYTITNCLLTRGDILPGGDDVFMDFFNHINYVTVAKNVYFTNQHACFPPFSYLFYTFLNLLLPVGATSFHNAAGTTGRAYFIYAIYLVVLFISLAEVIHRYLKSNYSRNSVFGLTILISLSYCFANGVIERGNASLIVLLLLLVSIHLKDSENPVCRELSLLFIAFAAGFKVYPAIWGLQYIKEKRYKEAFRLLIYGVVVFFLPFAFFGGLAGVRQFIINQSLVQNGLDSDISLYSMLSGIIANQSIVNAAWIVLCLLLFVIYFASNTSFQQYIMLSMIMIIAPKWSGSYTLVYTMIPFLLFLKQDKWIRGAMDFLIMLALSVGLSNLTGLNTGRSIASKVHMGGNYLALILVSVCVLFGYYQSLASIRRKFISTVAVCTALIVVFFVSVDVSTKKALETPFAGKGTAKEPYQISNAEEFRKFSDMVNRGETFEGLFFLQTVNLDLENREWTPIGLFSFNCTFKGTYDGGNHCIKNLSITSAYPYDPANVGLFGVLDGTVKNLGIESGSITGECVGSIASHGTDKARIINCYNKASVSGTYRAGGICDNLGGGQVINCVNVGPVSCPDVAAQIVSYSAGLIAAVSPLENAYADTMSGTYVDIDLQGDSVGEMLNDGIRNLQQQSITNETMTPW